MDTNFTFLEQLNDKQRDICVSTNNYVLTACPGSGKTRTITYRLAYLHQKNLPSRLLNIAITYTNRAADEIFNRIENMDIDASTVWTGTIHQFCMKFIIRPYAMYSERLRNGYHIIDEFVKKQYCDEIATSLGIKVGFEDPLSYSSIKLEYDKRLFSNKEIDFNLILDLSDSLLSDYPFIAENISHIIRSIHVDEFQDTNELQYSILSKIVQKNKKINVLFVGDVNQAIYGSLGGVAKSTASLSKQFGIVFKDDKLTGCYRSTQRIIDLYTNFEVSKTGVVSVSSKKDLCGVVALNSKIDKNDLAPIIAQIIKKQILAGVHDKDICVVAPQWYQIYPIAKQLREELPLICFDAPDVLPFKYDPLNPFYMLARLLFTSSGVNVKARKRTASEVLEILEADYRISIPNYYDSYRLLKTINSSKQNTCDGLTFYKQSIDYLFQSMQISINEEKQLYDVYTAFINKAEQRIKKFDLPCSCDDFYTCFKERNGVVVNTIHGIKGEEYEIVIGFDLLNGHLPHWDYIYDREKSSIRKEETLKLLYVLCSRAKSELFLFSETGRTTKKGYQLNMTDELRSVIYDYDVL